MTKTLLLAVTYIGVTVDSLFTSWWKGAWPILRPLPSPRSAFTVFELFLMDDWNRSLTLFFFFFLHLFFFSICTNNESFCYFVSIFFLFILVLWSKLSGEQAKFSLSIKKKKNYCQ